MQKIIVTGGLGFIGSNLIELLLTKKFKVLNIDKTSYASNVYNVKDFLKIAFKTVNLDYKNYIEINKSLIRKNDINKLRANNLKARKILKWKPKISFKKLVTDMVNYEINLLKKSNI